MSLLHSDMSFECRTCRQVCPTMKEVQKHIYNRHLPNVVWPLKCAIEHFTSFASSLQSMTAMRGVKGRIYKEPVANPSKMELTEEKFFRRSSKSAPRRRGSSSGEKEKNRKQKKKGYKGGEASHQEGQRECNATEGYKKCHKTVLLQ